MRLSLGSIVDALGGELSGDVAREIEGLAPLESAEPTQLSFLSNPRLMPLLATSKAGCVIVAPAQFDAARARGDCIVTPHPYLYFARVTQLWKSRSAPARGPAIHPSAVVDADAVVDPTARIGALCVVERGARIGAGTVLKARVTVAEGCVIGERCTLHPGAVIGADGFGFAPNEGAWEKIEQLGGVRIGNDVDIGANTCIDRGALADTVIEDGVKLDNLIQVGHNVRIGRNTAVAGCVGIAGSANIGAHCTIGGAAMILGHLTLVDGVNISAGSFVSRSIGKPGHYSGIFPIDDNASWEKNAATLKQLHKLLPHRYPFLLVDRVLGIEHGKSIRTLKNVTINEPFFGGHFPHRPVMPGVLMLEALAQSAALLSFATAGVSPDSKTVYYFAGIDAARFKRPVEPGDQLVMSVTILRVKAGIYKFKGEVHVADELACEAELMCTMRTVD